MLDYALFHSGLAEEDVRQTAFELDLLQAEEAKDVFAKVAAEIVKHLEGGDEDPEPQEEEELAAESGVQPQYDQN